MANSCNHLKALLKKNWILFKRSPCGSCCEILTPIVFVFFLLAVRGLVSKDNMNETSYYAHPTTFTKSPQINASTFLAYNQSNESTKTSILDQVYKAYHLK